MKRIPIYVTVRQDSTTAINGYPQGFPVDGDVLHDRTALRKRAEKLLAADQDLLSIARAWLGSPLHPNDPPFTPDRVVQHISTLFPGGAPRFVATAHFLQKEPAAS